MKRPAEAPHSLYFDRQDRELLAVVDRALEQRGGKHGNERALYDSLLHPHGILELATTHAERMALFVVNLLDSLEDGHAERRLLALRSLHDEVLHAAQTTFRYNTGRVLIQMMKEIVRSRGDDARRLMLAHDFRLAAGGNPRIVRRFLKQYHLLEMPEAWNQLAMDHHVHDSNTKGRKNPTHLIMDAWIKGLRFLTVIYYNYVTPEAMRELFAAADIMRITVRIGIEFRLPFRGRSVSMVWEPAVFADKRSILDLLADPAVIAMMQEGREASQWVTSRILHALHRWNTERRPVINAEFGVEIPPLGEDRFLQFVGTGQASLLHLAEKLHRWMLPLLDVRYRELEQEAERLEHLLSDKDAETSPSCSEDTSPDDPKDRLTEIYETLHTFNTLTPESILHTWLSEYDDAASDSEPLEDVPPILRMSPWFFLDKINRLHVNSNAWLNLAGLFPEDVLELLWDCKGKITHLEIFNLKEWQEGRTPHLAEISQIQQALNDSGPLHLKHIIRILLHENESSDAHPERIDKLREILRNIKAFQAPYLARPLRSRIGTDSTSNSSFRHGMGLLLPESLPRNVQRQIRRDQNIPGNNLLNVPVHLTIFQRTSFLPLRRNLSLWSRFMASLCKWTGWQWSARYVKREWIVYSNTARIEKPGNVITIGGIGGSQDNGFVRRTTKEEPVSPGWRYLNTSVMNSLKVACGFIAAMLTFLYTQDWWLLAWFGAAIWFAITAVRNVLQAVLSGRGIVRRSLLRWKDYISTTRICDSLMYTGFSVPLLECFIRVFLLQNTFGLTVADRPILVFTVMAAANGLYLASHNLYRGLPRAAIIGNVFRSVLAIPCALLYHDLLLILLPLLGVAAPVIYLQLGAAVISKAASDTVAGLIEGIADRSNSLRLRYWDYKTKLIQLVDTYTRLEVAYPESDILRLLTRPRSLLRFTESGNKSLQVALIISALDLLYFWHYQPQAQRAMAHLLRVMTRDERLILARSQLVLTQVREISQLFVDGLLGEHFAKALSFYLDYYAKYLNEMNALCLMYDDSDTSEIFAQEEHEHLPDDALPYDSRRDKDAT